MSRGKRQADCSHIENTESIAQLIVTGQGSGVKGVCRITAVTGDVAKDATVWADAFRVRLASIARMEAKDKAAATKLATSVSRLLDASGRQH